MNASERDIADRSGVLAAGLDLGILVHRSIFRHTAYELYLWRPPAPDSVDRKIRQVGHRMMGIPDSFSAEAIDAALVAAAKVILQEASE